jgi:hypothetical protein
MPSLRLPASFRESSAQASTPDFQTSISSLNHLSRSQRLLLNHHQQTCWWFLCNSEYSLSCDSFTPCELSPTDVQSEPVTFEASLPSLRDTSRPQGTDDDTMAAQMLPRLNHIGALTALDPNTKIPRTPSTYKKVRFVPTTRITSATTIRSKYKPVYVRTMEEQRHHTLLAGISLAAFNEGLASLSADPSAASPSANMSLRRDIIAPLPLTATPSTPPLTSK